MCDRVARFSRRFFQRERLVSSRAERRLKLVGKQGPAPSSNPALTNPASAWAEYCVGAYNSANPSGDHLISP